METLEPFGIGIVGGLIGYMIATLLKRLRQKKFLLHGNTFTKPCDLDAVCDYLTRLSPKLQELYQGYSDLYDAVTVLEVVIFGGPATAADIANRADMNNAVIIVGDDPNGPPDKTKAPPPPEFP